METWHSVTEDVFNAFIQHNGAAILDELNDNAASVFYAGGNKDVPIARKFEDSTKFEVFMRLH